MWAKIINGIIGRKERESKKHNKLSSHDQVLTIPHIASYKNLTVYATISPGRYELTQLHLTRLNYSNKTLTGTLPLNIRCRLMIRVDLAFFPSCIPNTPCVSESQKLALSMEEFQPYSHNSKHLCCLPVYKVCKQLLPCMLPKFTQLDRPLEDRA